MRFWALFGLLVGSAVVVGVYSFGETPPVVQRAPARPLALFGGDQTSPRAIELKPIATVRHEQLPEMSGLAKSNRYKDTYWVQNDSGDKARIFAIHSNGDVIGPTSSKEFWFDTPENGKRVYPGISLPKAQNNDFEEVCIDGETLYVSDCGNNSNARKNLVVYAVPEPDPTKSLQATSPQKFPVSYEDQKDFPANPMYFDCEAIFRFKGKTYFITKHRGASNVPLGSANIYVASTWVPDQENVLKKVDSKNDLEGWVSACSISPDGKYLAVLCQAPVQSIWLFELPKSGESFFHQSAKRLVFTGGKQCEGLTFIDSDSILMSNEQRELFVLHLRDFSGVE